MTSYHFSGFFTIYQLEDEEGKIYKFYISDYRTYKSSMEITRLSSENELAKKLQDIDCNEFFYHKGKKYKKLYPVFGDSRSGSDEIDIMTPLRYLGRRKNN